MEVNTQIGLYLGIGAIFALGVLVYVHIQGRLKPDSWNTMLIFCGLVFMWPAGLGLLGLGCFGLTLQMIVHTLGNLVKKGWNK